MSHEEVDSQLSAMFDGELPAEECELLSRRLGRDDLLRARWSRYAVIGAAMRSEPVSGASIRFARTVRDRLEEEGTRAAGAPAQRRGGRRLLWSTAVGSGLVAGVAGLAVLVLRTDMRNSAPGEELTDIVVASQRFEFPKPGHLSDSAGAIVGVDLSPAAAGGSVALPAQLANYVVAHSEYSSPLARRGLLSALVSSEGAVTAESAGSQHAEEYGAK